MVDSPPASQIHILMPQAPGSHGSFVLQKCDGSFHFATSVASLGHPAFTRLSCRLPVCPTVSAVLESGRASERAPNGVVAFDDFRRRRRCGCCRHFSLSLSLSFSLSLSARQIGRLSLSAAGYDDTELGIEKLEEGMEDGSSELAGWLAG